MGYKGREYNYGKKYPLSFLQDISVNLLIKITK